MARADGVYDGSDMQCWPGHALGGVKISGPDGANDAYPGPDMLPLLDRCPGRPVLGIHYML